MPLDNSEIQDIDSFVSGVMAKYPTVDAGSLTQSVTNINKYYKTVAESHTGIVEGDIDVFRDISTIVTAKFYTASVLNELASVQPLDNVFGYIYRLTFEYGDDMPAEGVTAGQSLSEVRTSGYATDPGENVIPRRLKAELRQELVEAKLRPLDLSSTFQSLLRRASVYGKGNTAVFNNQFLNAAYMKLRDELELSAINQIDASVPAGNVVTYTDPASTTPCTERECEYGEFQSAVSEASRRVYDNTGYMPNVVVIGPEALNIMDRWIKQPNTNMIDTGMGGLIPQRGRIGVFAKRWVVYYDPSVVGKALVGAFDPQNPMNNPLVYAPYINLAVTPEIMDRDLSTSQVVFAVDRTDVTEPAFFARVDIV
jgi:hypothetical protein